MRRENSQQVSETPGLSGHAESSTFEARSSPHASTSSSFRRRRDSPTNASLIPSSHRRQLSPIQTLEIPDSLVPPSIVDVYEFVPPSTDDVIDLVSPSEGEVVADAELEAFG